jgi:hypothetical protein
MEGLRVVYVDPRGTSKTPPNGKLLRFINYRFVELGNTVTSRDVVASWNLALKALQRMRGSRVTWSPDSPRSEAVKNPSQAGEPRGENHVFKNIYSYSSGNCLGETHGFKSSSYMNDETSDLIGHVLM